MDKKQIGQLIRLARKERGWTQFNLARKYRCCQANISDIERGEISLDLAELEHLAGILGKSLYYFFPPVESELKSLDEALQIMRSLPADQIRDEAIANILAIAQDVKRRVASRQE